MLFSSLLVYFPFYKSPTSSSEIALDSYLSILECILSGPANLKTSEHYLICFARKIAQDLFHFTL